MQAETINELSRIRDECKSMVTKRASVSGAAAVIPLPGVDIGSDVALLLEMIPAINRRFGLSQEQIEAQDPHIKGLILVAITSVGSQLIGKTITKQLIMQLLKQVGIRMASKQVVKWIPFAGSLLAGTISFSAMKYLGNSHVDDCYSAARLILEKKRKEFEHQSREIERPDSTHNQKAKTSMPLAMAMLSPVIREALMHQNGDQNAGDTPSEGTQNLSEKETMPVINTSITT
jgi:uncharacterized protein (DUF697 family)